MAQFQRACGECGFATGWTTESSSEHQLLAHYHQRHPNIDPGGAVQIRDGSPLKGGESPGIGAGGCCAVAAILLVLFFLFIIVSLVNEQHGG